MLVQHKANKDFYAMKILDKQKVPHTGRHSDSVYWISLSALCYAVNRSINLHYESTSKNLLIENHCFALKV